MASLGDVVREQEQAVKAALLAEALDPAPARDPLPLAARAAAFGLDFTQPARVVVVRGGDGARVERALIAELERAHVPYLAQRRDTSLSALVQCATRTPTPRWPRWRTPSPTS